MLVEPIVPEIFGPATFELTKAIIVTGLIILPSYDELLETIAKMLDRMLTPEGGGNTEAGKEVLRQLAQEAQRFFDQLDTPTTVRRQP